MAVNEASHDDRQSPPRCFACAGMTPLADILGASINEMRHEIAWAKESKWFV